MSLKAKPLIQFRVSGSFVSKLEALNLTNRPKSMILKITFPDSLTANFELSLASQIKVKVFMKVLYKGLKRYLKPLIKFLILNGPNYYILIYHS